MKTRFMIGSALILAVVVGALGATALSQQDKAKPMSKDEMEMMEKAKAFATPGEAHKALNFKVGKWSADVKCAMTPGAPMMQLPPSTADVKWIFDGRYIEDQTEGSFMGQPFHGRGIGGYDNLKRKYVWSWIDNMGTGFMTAEGTYDASTKTFTYATEAPDVMTGKYAKARSVEKIVDNDHWTAQMFQNDKDGKEYMSMEINYTRSK